MKHIFSVVIIILFTNLYSQDFNKTIIELDTIVGTQITDVERKRYVLFEFVDSLSYDFSEVYILSDSTYRIEVNYTDGRIFDTVLSKSVIDHNKENILYMSAYYNAIEKQKDAEELTDSSLNKSLFETVIINGKLAVVNNKTPKKMIIKEGKYYHFKIKPKESKLSIEYNPLGSKEKDRFFKYAKVKHILLSDSTICLKVKHFNFGESTYIKVSDIQAIKQNTFESAFLKSIGLPSGYGFHNPLAIFYAPPILIFNLIFKMKHFNLNTDSKFITIEE